MKLSRLAKGIIAILIPLLVGYISGLFTRQGVDGWYATANKPGFNPPNWLFAPVWTALYILMGIALYIIWISRAPIKVKRTAIWIYAVQLTLNFCWSFIFFYFQETSWAFAEIIALWLMILLTIIWFAKVSNTAAWLLVPYILWVSFATVLNYYIWQLN